MREVSLETDRSRHVDGLEHREHRLPRVHAGPADFAFGGEALAVSRGDHAGLAEGRGDLLDRALLVLGGGLGGRGAVDADHAVLAHAVLVEDARDAAGLAHGVDELAALLDRAHRAVADGAWPHGRDERADGEVLRGDLVGHLADVGLARVGIEVGVEEEEVDAVELLSVDGRLGGELEHAVERDRGMVGAGFLADESGPHGVVQFHRVLLSSGGAWHQPGTNRVETAHQPGRAANGQVSFSVQFADTRHHLVGARMRRGCITVGARHRLRFRGRSTAGRRAVRSSRCW